MRPELAKLRRQSRKLTASKIEEMKDLIHCCDFVLTYERSAPEDMAKARLKRREAVYCLKVLRGVANQQREIFEHIEHSPGNAKEKLLEVCRSLGESLDDIENFHRNNTNDGS
jgi:hypothetical protein